MTDAADRALDLAKWTRRAEGIDPDPPCPRSGEFVGLIVTADQPTRPMLSQTATSEWEGLA